MFNPHSTKYFIITISITIIVGIDILPTYMAVYHMCAVHKVAKRGGSDILELELQTVVYHHIGAGK